MSYRVQSIVICKPLRTTVRSRCLSLPPRFTPRVFFPCGSYRNRIGMDGNGISVASEVLVGDRELLDKKIAAIRSGGPQKMQVIVDFDRTLTRYLINGQPGQSSHGLLQQGNPEYDAKRQQLYEYYHPLEFSPKIPIEEKTKLMEEWWGKTHALLIEGGLTYDAIKQSIANATIAFREGVAELFEYLEERDIPVLIFSAGLADIIEEVLRQKLHRSFKNVKIVSNRMVFDSDGCLVSFKGKTIHSLNKNEHALDMAAPLHEQLGDADGSNNNNASVKKRTNVLLLGDHIGDLGMSDGLNYETRISVGFLYQSTLKQLFQEFDNKDGTQLASVTMRIMQALQNNLDGKSKQYKDPALTHLFLMNNIHYMVRSVRRSEAKDLLGDDWVQRHRRIVQQHANQYKRNAWTKILQCLSIPGLASSGGGSSVGVDGGNSSGVSRALVKDRVKIFNTQFEELHQKQSQWTVPDTELCESLRLAVAEVLLPAYRSFVRRFGPLVENGRNPQRYIKYSADDLEQMLGEFFEGKNLSEPRR